MKRSILNNGQIVTGTGVRKGIITIEGEDIASILYEITPEETPEKILKETPDNESEKSSKSFLKIDLENYIKEYTSKHPKTEVIDLKGQIVMAGGIDIHVHFREPGMTHKGDFESESRAALLGGITSIVDMPNTNPLTTSKKALQNKLDLAKERMFCNYSFHMGATNNSQTLKDDYPTLFDYSKKENKTEKCSCNDDLKDFAGVKVFMGSSTGNMLVDDNQTLKELFSIEKKSILIHSEDPNIISENTKAAKEKYGENIPIAEHHKIRSREACIKSTAKALEIALKHRTHLHILHISTAEEIEMIKVAKRYNPNITAESSANYMYFTDKDYLTKGGLVKCNPAIKEEKDRLAIRKAFKEGYIDTIGSDHAPHLLEEKDNIYTKCPSGLPTIQQSLPMILTIAKEDGIGLEIVTKAMSETPAKIVGLKDRGQLAEGFKADIVVIDSEAEYRPYKHLPERINKNLEHFGGKREFSTEELAYKCNWSPYEGTLMKSKVSMVFLNGDIKIKDGKLINSIASGKALKSDF